jgi:hypothetical protein
MTESDHSRQFDGMPMTSGLPPRSGHRHGPSGLKGAISGSHRLIGALALAGAALRACRRAEAIKSRQRGIQVSARRS